MLKPDEWPIWEEFWGLMPDLDYPELTDGYGWTYYSALGSDFLVIEDLELREVVVAAMVPLSGTYVGDEGILSLAATLVEKLHTYLENKGELGNAFAP